MPHPYLSLPTPIVLGHRGAAGEVPENTLESFRRGLADGAAIVETDLHATRDGALVLHHDADVARTTDGSGPIAELTLAEVQKLDAGYRFGPEAGHPYRGKGLGIPTLDEAFAAFPGVRFNIEVKADPDGTVERVIDTVERAGRLDRTLLAAEKDPIMARIRDVASARRISLATSASVGDALRFVRAAVDGARPPDGPLALQIPAAFGGRPVVTRELVAYAHRHAVQVHVWTVNDPAEMKRLLALGVDGLISDFPARVRDVIEGRL